jgi:hypothetical protein
MSAAFIICGLFLLAFAQNAIAISPAQQQTPPKQRDTISMLVSERQPVPGDKFRSLLLWLNTRRATMR